MDKMIPVLIQTAGLFLLILIGYIAKRLRWVTDEFSGGLAGFITNVTLPLLIITSMNKEFTMEALRNSILIIVFGTISYFIAIGLSIIFSKIFKTEEPQKGVYKFLIIFSNTAFMGFPILKAMFGEEGIFYGAIFNILFNVFLWTIGVHIVSAHSDNDDSDADSKGRFKKSLKKLINPGTISVALGLLVFVSPVKIPYLVYNPMRMLGDTTIPLAMVVIGAVLAETKIREMFANTKLYIASFVRLLLLPLILVPFLSLFNLPSIVSVIVVVLSSMPAAANTAILAKIYGSDYKLASQGVFMNTLLNMITIPITLYLTTFI